MDEYVLFAPVGDTDPVCMEFDGPVMHIVRHYHRKGLKKIYLFLTAKMCENEDTDNRYEESIRRFSKGIEIIKWRHPEITDPSDFNNFFEIYPRLLQKIKDENPKAKILLNITSGTPQMILALSMCSARNKSYLSVQTKSPIKSRKPQKLDFDKIFCNKDDGDDAEKRVAGVDFSELKKTILVEQLKALIKEYDYHGAYTLCTSKSNENFFEEKTKSFLRHAHHRFKLDIDEARKANDSEELYPVQYDAARDAFEYYLITKIKMLTSDFNSFAVNIKILAEKLAFCALTEHGTNPDEFSCKEENGEIKLSRDKAPEKLLELLDGIYQTPFNDGGEINLAARIKCIEYYLARLPEKSVLLNKLNIINNEIANRNLIAHNLKYINEKAFQSTPGKICKSLEILFVKIFPTHITEENFNIYDKLNERIIGSL